MGKKPQKSGNSEQGMAKALTWTALTTIATAAVEGLVQKYVNKNKN